MNRLIFQATLMLLLVSGYALAYDGDKPESHDGAWMALHGEAATGDMASCLDCHEDRVSCIACHMDKPPRSHNASWRRKVHGLKARWDRDRCLACHQEDLCIECHKSTPPFSHRPGWGGLDDSQNRHCGSCHYPVQETRCFTCHQTAHAPNGFSR